MVKIFMAFLMMSTQLWAQDVVDRKFKFKYEGLDQYRVSFTRTTVTWEGIQGVDLGRKETDLYQSAHIAPGIWMLQWKENDGTFVALTVNLYAKTIVSTGVAGDYQWFKRGILEDVTPGATHTGDPCDRRPLPRHCM